MTTQEEEIVTVLAHLVPAGCPALGVEALAQARAIRGEIVPHLQQSAAYASLWQQFQADPAGQAGILAAIVASLLQDNATLAARLDQLLAHYRQATGTAHTVNTGGGAYVGGSVTVTNGEFIGRDSVRITGDGNVIGDHSSSTVIKQQGADTASIVRAFTAFYSAVAAQPALPPQDKADLRQELEEVETELKKGEEADEGFLRRRLRNIKRMAPDIYDVVLATFANPVAGLGMVAKKVAEKMRAEGG